MKESSIIGTNRSKIGSVIFQSKLEKWKNREKQQKLSEKHRRKSSKTGAIIYFGNINHSPSVKLEVEISVMITTTEGNGCVSEIMQRSVTWYLIKEDNLHPSKWLLGRVIEDEEG